MTSLVGACDGAAAAACACGGLGGPAQGPAVEAPLLLLLCACGRVGGRGTGKASGRRARRPGDGAMGKASGAPGSAAGDGATGGAPILAAARQPNCRGERTIRLPAGPPSLQAEI